jgi:hypothetical protein
MSLLLYPMSYIVEHATGLEPMTSGATSGALPLSYTRSPGVLPSGGTRLPQGGARQARF